MRNASNKNCKETQNTHFMFSRFFSEYVPFMKKYEKYGRARQATDDSKYGIEKMCSSLVASAIRPSTCSASRGWVT
jgi:hypothetical protein